MQQRFSVAPSSLLMKRWRLPLSLICIAGFVLLSSAFAFGLFNGKPTSVHANPQAIDNPSAPPSFGINLIGETDSATDFLFADAFKTWRLQAAPGQSNPPSTDANGWPQGDFSALMWDGAFLSHNTTGTYALRFNGKANVTASGGNLSSLSYDAGSNTTSGTYTIPSDGVTPVFTFTNTQRTNGSATNTGVTNIQLMRPQSPGSSSSYSFSTTFTTPIKDLISKFQAIRFMDYSATNSNGQVNWSDRRLPQENQQGPAHNSNTYGWEGLGAAWEYAIQLCNETNRDCYINVPEQATGSSSSDTSSYIYKLAQLFKYGSDANGNVYTSTQSNPVHAPLNSSLHLYVEYSNEVWNTGGGINFAQAGQNHDAAKAEVQAGGSPLNYDGDTGDWDWAWRRQAKRIKETSEIFRAVFGDSAMMSRIRPLLEWQYGNGQGTAYNQLSFLEGYYDNGRGNYVSNPHPASYYIWGGGGATYSTVNNPGASSIDAIYNSGLATSDFTTAVTTDANFAKGFGLHYVSYEGGFNIGGDVPTDLQKQANIDPRAKDAEKTFQNIFNQAGGDLLMYFNSSGSGPYSMAFPDVFTQNTPKLQALNELSQSAQAAATNGTNLPASIDGNNWSLNSRGWGTPGSGSLNPFGTITSSYGTPAISWVTYTVRSGSASNYTVTVNYSSSINGGFSVWAGGSLIGHVSVSNTNGSNVNSAALNASFPAGVSALRLVADAGSDNFTINSIQVGSGGSGNPTPTPTQSNPTPTPTQPAGGSWTFCANEGGTCTFSGTHQVRYGANGTYNYQTATGSIDCNNVVFGDPTPGVAKHCDVSSDTATATSTPTPTPTTWTKCADENGTCTFSGTHQVRYGANNSWVYQTATNSIACNNATFGSDPAPGVFKACYYS